MRLQAGAHDKTQPLAHAAFRDAQNWRPCAVTDRSRRGSDRHPGEATLRGCTRCPQRQCCRSVMRAYTIQHCNRQFSRDGSAKASRSITMYASRCLRSRQPSAYRHRCAQAGCGAPRRNSLTRNGCCYLWTQPRLLSNATFAERDSSTARPVVLVLTFPRIKSWHATAATQPTGTAGLCTSKRR